MVADRSKFLEWFFVFILLCLHVSLAHSYSLAQYDGKVHRSSFKEILRNRRQVCIDGYYEHEGIECCLCAAGQYLEKHCTTTKDDRKCGLCRQGTYNSHPNSQETCLPCTSCSQPNANLEEAERCTPASDAKCRCKKDHYCNSNTGICKICHPCKECGSDGIKEACTATSDTVCNETPASNTTGAIIAGVLFGLLLLAGLSILFYFRWRKRQEGTGNIRRTSVEMNDIAINGKMPLLEVSIADLQRLLPKIADELGWKDMKHLAVCDGINDTVIESCKLDNQGDSQEQTLQLLKKWVEMHGKDASKKLIKYLQDSGKKAKAEKIQDIFSGAAK